MTLLEIVALTACIVSIVSALVTSYLYFDMYRTTRDDLRDLRNRIFNEAMKEENGLDATTALGTFYMELSEIIRNL